MPRINIHKKNKQISNGNLPIKKGEMRMLPPSTITSKLYSLILKKSPYKEYEENSTYYNDDDSPR